MNYICFHISNLGEPAADKEDGGGDSEGAKPVSVANHQQCCGALNSGACKLI